MNTTEPASGQHVIRPSEIGWVMEPRTGNPSEGVLSLIVDKEGKVTGDIARTTEGMRVIKAAIQFDEKFITMQALSGIVAVLSLLIFNTPTEYEGRSDTGAIQTHCRHQ